MKTDEFYFEMLCQMLMEPTEAMKIDFVEALFFIQEMLNDEHFEELSERAEANNIDVHEDHNSGRSGYGAVAI